MTNNMEIVIGPKGLQARMVKSGVTHVKAVALRDVAAKLNQGTSVNFGLLPVNTRTSNVVGNHYIVGTELPPLKIDINVTNADGRSSVVKKVALPASLFVFVLTKTGQIYKQAKAFVFALENDRIILPKDKLFKMPLPNIYNIGDNRENEICWGDKQRQYDLQSLASAEGLVKTFFAAYFNSDLFGTNKTSPKFPWDKISSAENVKEYFQLLAGEPEFKREWLTPCSAPYATYTTAIETIMSSLRV